MRFDDTPVLGGTIYREYVEPERKYRMGTLR